MTDHSNKDFQNCQSEIIISISGVEYNLVPKSNTYTSKDNLVSGSNFAGNENNDWEIIRVREKYSGKIYYTQTDRNGKKTINDQSYDYVLNARIGNTLDIECVRRSDGELFSIGDEVLWDWIECSKPYLTINGFEICDGTLRILANGDSFNFKNLSESKLRKKAPITKTEALFVVQLTEKQIDKLIELLK